MSDTQGTWKGSAPFGTGWNADVVEAVGSDLEINNGTIDVAAITADTLWGNPQTIAAKPTPVAIGPGLTLPATGTLAAQWQTGTVVSKVGSDLSVNSGTIDLAPITAASLYGNPGTAAAKPSAIAVGSGLTLSAVGTLSNTGILSLVIGSGLSPAGTISSGGTTVSLGTIAASSLMGNPGTAGAVPGAIAVGTNLTLSAAGTLSASAPGTGTVTQVVAGAGLAGGTITTAGTVSAQWQGGTVTAEGNSVVINSGTIDFDQTPTYFSASRTLATTDRGLWLVDNSAGASDVIVTLPSLTAGTKLNTAIQCNSTTHVVRLRPAVGVTIDGVASSDYLLGTFTGARVAIDSTGTGYVVDAGNIFWQPSAGYISALNGLATSNNGTFNTNGTLQPVVDGTSIKLVGGTLQATGINGGKVALIHNSATQAVAAGSNVTVAFGAGAFDTGAFYPGSGNGFVIPAGVSYVRLAAGVNFPVGGGTGVMLLNFAINGTIDGARGMPEARWASNSNINFISIVSGVVPVTAGDTLTVNTFLTNANTILVGNSNFFSIEALG